MKRIHAKAMVLWRVRLVAVTFLCPFATALFFSGSPVWRTVLTTLWICAFLGMYLAYYPVKYKKLSYLVNEHALIIYCGVFYNRIKAIELRNIQHVTVASTPLQHLMGLASVYVSGAGGMVYIPCLGKQAAATLCARLVRAQRLTQRGGEDA